MIMGEQEQFEIIGVQPRRRYIFDLSNTIKDAMKNMDSDECIIFTDLGTGASPTNAAVIALAEVKCMLSPELIWAWIMEAFVTRNQTVSLSSFRNSLSAPEKMGFNYPRRYFKK